MGYTRYTFKSRQRTPRNYIGKDITWKDISQGDDYFVIVATLKDEYILENHWPDAYNIRQVLLDEKGNRLEE